MKRSLTKVVCYGALGAFLAGPSLTELGTHVPGQRRTEVWDSLWQTAQFSTSLSSGESPWWSEALNDPHGMLIWHADPLGALLVAPLVWLFGLSIAYTVLIWAHIAFAGCVAHGFAEDWLASRVGAEHRGEQRGAWVAGVGFASTPVLWAAVHNGDLSAIGMGWGALIAWMGWRAVSGSGLGRMVPLALALVAASTIGWGVFLSGVVFCLAFLFVGHATWGRRLFVIGMAVGLMMFIALLRDYFLSSAVGIVGMYPDVSAADLRRSIGAAQPAGFFGFSDAGFARSMWGRVGERYRIVYSVGCVVSLLALSTLGRRRRGSGVLWAAAVLGLVMALGPVLVHNGAPWVLSGGRVIPMPYVLVEGIPGFSALRQPLQLVQVTALALALLGGLACQGRRRHWVVAVLVALILDATQFSSTADLRGQVSTRAPAAIHALALAPAGAVMNYPFVSVRPYLYEASIHGHPVAGRGDKVRNSASRKLWRTMRAHAHRDSADFSKRIRAAAKKAGIRYVVLHNDPDAPPDMYDIAVKAIERGFSPLPIDAAGGDEPNTTRVISLWP